MDRHHAHRAPAWVQVSERLGKPGWQGFKRHGFMDVTPQEQLLSARSIFTAIVYACAGVICALVALVGLQALVHSKQKRPWAAAVHVTVLLR